MYFHHEVRGRGTFAHEGIPLATQLVHGDLEAFDVGLLAEAGILGVLAVALAVVTQALLLVVEDGEVIGGGGGQVLRGGIVPGGVPRAAGGIVVGRGGDVVKARRDGRGGGDDATAAGLASPLGPFPRMRNDDAAAIGIARGYDGHAHRRRRHGGGGGSPLREASRGHGGDPAAGVSDRLRGAADQGTLVDSPWGLLLLRTTVVGGSGFRFHSLRGPALLLATRGSGGVDRRHTGPRRRIDAGLEERLELALPGLRLLDWDPGRGAIVVGERRPGSVRRRLRRLVLTGRQRLRRRVERRGSVGGLRGRDLALSGQQRRRREPLLRLLDRDDALLLRRRLLYLLLGRRLL
mmetsp:Transcript_19803/g.47552  ORF Transcript_19803/g.47552 Transcript_19803/m.47552 type:complete len:349 (+) Transcript_19803:988-2034(+)